MHFMGNLISKFFRFIGVSGIGWILDFVIYTLLTGVAHLPVALSNYISTVPAITLVFFVSPRKLFLCRPDGLSLRAKYMLYVIYQLLLVTTVSFLAQWMAGFLPLLLPFLSGVAKLAAKVLITPVTMVCNFFVLKYLAEKW